MDWRLPLVILAFITATTGIVGLMAYEGDFGEELDYEDETQTNTAFGPRELKGEGVFSGVESPATNELFDTRVIIMAHSPDMWSQKIVVQGKLTGGKLTGEDNSKFRYCYSVKTVGGVEIRNDIISGSGSPMKVGGLTERNVWYNIYAFASMEGYLNIEGCWTQLPPEGTGQTVARGNLLAHIPRIDGITIPHGSILRVSLEYYGRTWGWEANRWETLAVDETLLRTGIGSILLDREDNYEVGETALVTVEIPYVETEGQSGLGEGGLGFFFKAVHYNTAAILTDINGNELSKVRLTGLSTLFRIPIKEEYFIASDPMSRLDFYLYNELTEKDEDWASVVIDRATAPLSPIVGSDKPEYFEGDTVTIEWSCPDNPKSNASVVGSLLIAHISGMRVHEQYYEGKEGTATFIAPISGVLEYKSFCYDSAGQATGNKEQAIIHNLIQTDWCSLYPDDPICKPKGPDFPLWEVLLLLFAIIGITIITIIIASVASSFGLDMKFVILIAILTFVLLLVMVIGLAGPALDKITAYMAYQGA